MLLRLNIKNTCLLHITQFKPPESPVHTHTRTDLVSAHKYIFRVFFSFQTNGKKTPAIYYLRFGCYWSWSPSDDYHHKWKYDKQWKCSSLSTQANKQKEWHRIHWRKDEKSTDYSFFCWCCWYERKVSQCQMWTKLWCTCLSYDHEIYKKTWYNLYFLIHILRQQT